MRYRVSLNGTLLDNEPIGLTESELIIERDELTKGIRTQYETEITFWGDGYTLCKNVLDTDDCAQVTCLIEIQCANDQPWLTLFEGIIPIGDEGVEWDLQNCTLKTNLEAADFSDLISRYGDYKILVQSATSKCIDGTTALTGITQRTTDFFSGFAGTYASTNRKTFQFTEVLQQAMSFISNNLITVDFDPLYTTLYARQELEVTFVDPLANTDVVEIVFTNYYGQIYTVTQTIGATVSTSVDELFAKLLHFIPSSAANPYETRTNYFEKASNTSTAGGVYTIQNYLPWRAYSISVNSGAKNATISATQDYAYGLKNLGISNSTCLAGQDGSIYVTVRQLLTHITNFHNCSFRFIDAGATYTLQIRKYETFLDDTSTTLTLNNVPDIIMEASSENATINLTTPNGKADNVFKPLTYNTGYCYGENVEVKGDNYSSQEIFDILGGGVEEKQDDKLFYFFYTEGDYTLAERYDFGLGEVIAGTSTLNGPYYHYNIPYLGPLIAARYNVNAGLKTLTTNIIKSANDPATSTCSGCPIAAIQNTNTKNLRRLYTFDYPLTHTEVRTLISNQLNYIYFNDGRGFSRNGFFKKVKIAFKNLVTSFELFSN